MRNVLIVICLFILFPFLMNAQWTKYDTTNSEIPGNQIYDIVVDYGNNIWIGTDQGLAKLNSGSWTIYDSTNSPLSLSVINDIHLDFEGNIWISNDEKIVKYSENTFSVLDSSINANKIIIDRNGNIIINNRYSLYQFNGIDWEEIFKPDPPQTGYPITNILFDEDNNIWFSDYWGDGFMGKINGSYWRFTAENSGMVESSVNSISLDSSNKIWIGGREGITKFDPRNNQWEHFQDDTILKPINTIVSDIAFDASETLWCTVNASTTGPWYLMKFTGNSWTYFEMDSLIDIPFNYIHSIAVSFDNKVYIGSGWGLFVYEYSTTNISRINNKDLKIYPNPATTSLNIEFDEKYNFKEYRIIDLKGVELLKSSGHFSANQSIDIDELPKGIYIIELSTSSGEIVREKFVKY